MNRKARWLRIIWIVLCGIVVVLLLAMWVRSFSRMDTVPLWNHVDVYSVSGRIIAVAGNRDVVFGRDELQALVSNMRFEYLRGPGFGAIVTPHWMPIALIAVSGLVAASPSIRQLNWRYSLRDLLITTTLTAVALGVIMWLVG